MAPGLSPGEEDGSGGVGIAALRRQFGGLARGEDPAAAEEDEVAAAEAGPAGDFRHVEAGEPGERLQALAADLHQEGDEALRAHAAGDERHDLQGLGGRGGPEELETAGRRVPAHGQLGQGDDLGVRVGAFAQQLDLMAEEGGAQAGVGAAAEVVVGDLGEDRALPRHRLPAPRHLAGDGIDRRVRIRAAEQIGEAGEGDAGTEEGVQRHAVAAGRNLRRLPGGDLEEDARRPGGLRETAHERLPILLGQLDLGLSGGERGTGAGGEESLRPVEDGAGFLRAGRRGGEGLGAVPGFGFEEAMVEVEHGNAGVGGEAGEEAGRVGVAEGRLGIERREETDVAPQGSFQVGADALGKGHLDSRGGVHTEQDVVPELYVVGQRREAFLDAVHSADTLLGREGGEPERERHHHQEERAVRADHHAQPSREAAFGGLGKEQELDGARGGSQGEPQRERGSDVRGPAHPACELPSSRSSSAASGTCRVSRSPTVRSRVATSTGSKTPTAMPAGSRPILTSGWPTRAVAAAMR